MRSPIDFMKLQRTRYAMFMAPLPLGALWEAMKAPVLTEPSRRRSFTTRRASPIYQLAGKNIRANTVSPRQHFLRGRGLGSDPHRQSGALQDRARAEPHRKNGHAAGDGEHRGLSRQPRRELHHRHEPRRRRRVDKGCAAIGALHKGISIGPIYSKPRFRNVHRQVRRLHTVMLTSASGSMTASASATSPPSKSMETAGTPRSQSRNSPRPPGNCRRRARAR
jgi:hypothetical protein